MSRALLLVGHGSHLSADSSAPVYAHAERIRARREFDEVGTAFWKEEPSLSRAMDGLDADDLTVVPVFMSDGYFTNQVVPREMALAGRVSCVGTKKVRYTSSIGGHPSLSRVVVERARDAGAEGRDALVLLGHGTERNRQSQANVYQHAESIRAAGMFAEVAVVFLDQQPSMLDVFDLTRAAKVVVVPFFVADGWHAGETIPGDLGGLRQNGRLLHYAGAVGTHPAVADVILELAHEAAEW